YVGILDKKRMLMQTQTLHRFSLYVCAQFSVRIDKEKTMKKRRRNLIFFRQNNLIAIRPPETQIA
ncbi:hypothetical protein, partial [Hominenteromicrobium sp.]